MTPEQVSSVARLGGRVGAGIVANVEHVHGTVARRSFGPLGAPAAPVRLVHDAVARGVYALVGGAFVAAGSVAGVAGRAATPRRGADVGVGVAGNHAVSVLNAVVGHALAADDDPLAIAMAVRVDGADVAPTAGGLAAAFPDATGRLVVFVHGLGENERSWHRRSAHLGGDYGTRLRADLGCTPVQVRYNTGRHISDNGRDLAALLDEVVAHWPVPVEEVALVGHSMGGLVLRAACHHGADARWTPFVRHVVYLGSPHSGALLARGSRVLSWVLDKVPEVRPLGAAFDHSPGVRDLRFGYVVDDDWADCDGGTCLADHGGDVPLPATADHHVISAAVTGDADGPAARVVGDLLVAPASASGRRRGRPPVGFDAARVHHHPRLNHFDLLHHPAVYETLRGCLAC